MHMYLYNIPILGLREKAAGNPLVVWCQKKRQRVLLLGSSRHTVQGGAHLVMFVGSKITPMNQLVRYSWILIYHQPKLGIEVTTLWMGQRNPAATWLVHQLGWPIHRSSAFSMASHHHDP